MSYPRPRVLSFTLTANQIRVKLFLRAASMSVFNACGIYFIAHGSYYAGFTGFLIAWNWAGASRDIGDYRPRYSRLCYALGGAVGVELALLVSQMLYRMHLL